MTLDDIRWRPLDDLDAARLYRDFPHLNTTSEQYCPTCWKRGKYFWRDEWHDCECQMQLSLHRHYLAAGIGVPYQRLDWTDYEADDAAAHQVLDYLENPAYLDRGIGLLMMGRNGSGKSMLASLALKSFVKVVHSSFFATFAQTVDMFASTWRGDNADRDYFTSKFLRSKVLVLDDLGKEWRNKSKLAETTFDSILRQRVQHGLATIITTNLTHHELGEGYGSAVLSLLSEKSVHIEFGGQDYRPCAHAREMEEAEKGWVRAIV